MGCNPLFVSDIKEPILNSINYISNNIYHLKCMTLTSIAKMA